MTKTLEIEIEIDHEDPSELKSAFERILQTEVSLELEKESKTRSVYDRTQKSEPIVLAVLSVLAAKVIPSAIEAIRDIIVEFLRTRQCTIFIRKSDGSRVTFVGPIITRSDMERLEHVITEQTIQNERP